MRHIAWTFCVLTILTPALIAADKPKEESGIIAKSRTKLESPVTVDWKDTRFEDCIKEVFGMIDVSFKLEMGISRNSSTTYSAKEKPCKDVLDDILKDKGWGYIIHRKQNANDRYEGYVFITTDKAQRGDEITKDTAKADPKKPVKPDAKPPVKPDPKTDTGTDENKDEKLATSKLKQAKTFLEDGQKADAKEYLELIVKKYPSTKAAAEAKSLLEKLK